MLGLYKDVSLNKKYMELLTDVNFMVITDSASLYLTLFHLKKASIRTPHLKQVEKLCTDTFNKRWQLA